MTPGALPSDTSRRTLGAGALAAAAALLLIAVFELWRGSPHPGPMFAARATWAACLLATWWLGRRAVGEARTALYAAMAVISVLALALLCHLGGGPAAGPFAFLVAAPLFVAVFVPAERVAVAAAGVASTASALAVAGLAGEAPADVLLAGVRAAAAGGAALLGASVHLAARREELERERARAVAEEALARSEARRAAAERMAAAGDRAARAAHDMSSPLASVRANVDWLREELAADKDRIDLPEVRVVVEETAQGAERLVAEVQALRAAVRAARTGEPAAPPGGPPGEGTGPGEGRR